MSASPKKNVAAPKLRFSDFTEAWQKTRLVDVADIKRGAGSQYLTYVQTEHEGIRLIRIGDFLGSDPVFVEDTKDMKRFRLQRDDILIAGTGATAGITFKVPEKFIDFAFSYNAPRIRVREADSDFVVSYLKSGIILRQQHRLFTGNAQPFLDTAAIGGFKMRVPTLPEQRKIADFLTAVDGRIQQLSQKRALLQDYKKGVMQQLFTQALRFKDDHGNDFPDWEEKTLGEVLTIGSGRDYKHLGKGDVPVYGSGGVMTFVDASLYDGESVCIGRKGTIDKPRFLEGAFWTVDTLFYTHSFIRVIPRFIYAVFQQINWQTYNEASGVPSLSKSTIESIPVSIPHPAEQTKIANFLTALDRKIESVSQQIALTQTFKRGLLQQMFV